MFFRKGKKPIKLSGELTRLGDKTKTRSQLSCLSNTFCPLYNSFLSSLFLWTLGHLQFGTASSQPLIILRWVWRLAMNQAPSTLPLALGLLNCSFSPPAGGKAGKRKSEAYINLRPSYAWAAAIKKMGKEIENFSQREVSGWFICV